MFTILELIWLLVSILPIIICAVLCYRKFRGGYDPATGVFFTTLIFVFIWLPMCLLVCANTTGLLYGIEEGQFEGKLLQVDRSGLFWKTHSCILIFNDHMQNKEYFSFDHKKDFDARDVYNNIGNKVRITYTKSFIANLRENGSTKVITKIEVLK